MACTDGKNTYLNIKELPEISDIISGDFLIVETPNATSILDFANFLITLDNTTFGDVITTNTTNILTLSSQVISLSSVVDTYAVFSLSGYNSTGPKLIKGSNISSLVFQSTSAVRVNFTRSFQDNLYGFTTDSFLSSFAGPSSLADLTTGYIDIFIKDKNYNLTTTDRATVRIVGGQLA
jgi:hypothetical protein